MVMTKRKNKEIKVGGKYLEQMSQYRYLGSIIDELGSSLSEVKTRIGAAKDAFWKCKEFMRRDIPMQLKLRLLNCYIKSVVSYGCKTWTFSSEIKRRIDASQLWCYWKMLKIKYVKHISNTEVKDRLHIKQNWSEDLGKRKLQFAGHIMRESGNELMQVVLEGKIEGTRDHGRQRRTWADDVKEWSKYKSFGKTKRKMEDCVMWRNMIHNLHFEEVT